ncbi:MAG TPA: right-handed parallel beta-helix repeat-containing protein [Gemmatimonadales bacterium]|nr:right-handed parallel beta-helix repeat-containing protein [Gemmatimonadales bacterium]
MPRIYFAPVVACVCLAAPVSRRAVITVDCDMGTTIAGALARAKPADTVLVTGTCHESVQIPAELVRVTLDGQGRATIEPPKGPPAGPTSHAIFVRGRGITITRFRITGGVDGVHLSGPANAVIDGNVITENSGRGIHLDKSSVAQIVNNVISDNGGVGIHVTEQSYARIGFLIPPDEIVRPNTLRSNRGGGILVDRGSGAWIVGNAILENHGAAIVIDRGSQADIVANLINGHSGDGILVTRNSGVNLQSEGSRRLEGPNRTDSAAQNRGFGIKCSIGGYVAGPRGTLSGIQGATNFDAACVDHVTN